jgi:cell division protein FtsB
VKFLLGILVLILVLLQLRLWTGTGSLQDINRLEQNIAEQEQENAGLQQRNEGLRDEVTELKTGMDAFEERARSELGLVRKGETYFLIMEEPKIVPFERPQAQPEFVISMPEAPVWAEPDPELPANQQNIESQLTQ